MSVLAANGRLHGAFLDMVKDLPRSRDLRLLEDDDGCGGP
jgi:hypothetical protein